MNRTIHINKKHDPRLIESLSSDEESESEEEEEKEKNKVATSQKVTEHKTKSLLPSDHITIGYLDDSASKYNKLLSEKELTEEEIKDEIFNFIKLIQPALQMNKEQSDSKREKKEIIDILFKEQ